MIPTNRLKPRLYSYFFPLMKSCYQPTVFPKYTFYSNESRCQFKLTVASDEAQVLVMDFFVSLADSVSLDTRINQRTILIS
jgi:hypothetical protein